jgi:homopolymeric O-antigen transport system ATP-binding protein
MSDIAIRIENLSKRYKVNAIQQRYDTLRDQLVGGLKSLIWRKDRSQAGPATFWALSELSLEIKQGEVLGIIGRNGAGKSTLLKILSRITEPTAGVAEIDGRVGALLEVGTGFHGELSGRENIYLNAAILGMRKAEIKRKFDAIVDFSGVEEFIDTPVKHYSSGMYVRLAFAVAAHLEPEILIIDEVLAVGDVDFQNKCLGKMGEIAHAGRTVLFVSHNMGAISNLCTSVMWLDQGKLVVRGNAHSTISAYLTSSSTTSGTDPKHWRHRGTGEAQVTEVRLLDCNGSKRTIFSMGETIVIEFDVEFFERLVSVDIDIEIKRTDMGVYVLHLTNQDCGFSIGPSQKGKRRFRVAIPHCLLYPARYQILLCIWGPGGATFDHVRDIADFTMIQSNISKRTTLLSSHTEAVFYTPSEWQALPMP